ncbi:MAG: YraN family protein [Phycisphaerae bacterium]
MPSCSICVIALGRPARSVNSAFRKRLQRSARWLRRQSSRHLRLGARGERRAARFLKQQGFRVLARNYRCVSGEIDLVCARKKLLVFVEVKTRSSDESADPRDAVRPDQWRRIEHAAGYFIRIAQTHDRPCRFDLVAIHQQGRRTVRIEHVENAYQPSAPLG